MVLNFIEKLWHVLCVKQRNSRYEIDWNKQTLSISKLDECYLKYYSKLTKITALINKIKLKIYECSGSRVWCSVQ